MSKFKLPDTNIRLNKFIADSGLTSRRKADDLILSGVVKVDGKTVIELGFKVDPNNNKVSVNGQGLHVHKEFVYIMFNKPLQILCSLSDPEGRPTVADYFQHIPERIYPVGRLDWNSEGLLLLTNDGRFSQAVTHPSQSISKTYLVKLDGVPKESHLQKLLNGVTIVGGRVCAQTAELLKSKGSSKYGWVKIVISQGKNRQVRKMFEKIGFDVKKLQRIAIGQLNLGPLKRGTYVSLKKKDLENIFKTESLFRKPISKAKPIKKKMTSSQRKSSLKKSAIFHQDNQR